ncbi:hypothetical protein J4731_23325 [Providencia rettgeri]|nr:hypothetical protein [Providencia rettgeri]
MVEPTKPDVITHANEDKQVGVEPEVIEQSPVNENQALNQGVIQIFQMMITIHQTVLAAMLKDARISLMYYERRHQ